MKLEKGKLYNVDGKPWRCELVNPCRARLTPAWKETASFTEADGNERTFEATPNRRLDVSPRSVIEEWPS